jgi:hypothetical protein
LATAKGWPSGSGNKINGVFSGGDITGSYTATTDLYAFSSDTLSTGTAIGTARVAISSASSTPGHL